jgi:hypothetical protein
LRVTVVYESLALRGASDLFAEQALLVPAAQRMDRLAGPVDTASAVRGKVVDTLAVVFRWPSLVVGVCITYTSYSMDQ